MTMQIITLEQLETIWSTIDWEQIYREKKFREQHRWVCDIIRVLWGRRGGIHIDELVDNLAAIRTGVPWPKRARETVQSALNHHTRQSSVFASRHGKPENDLFFSPHGKGSGTWAVHRDTAAAWLMKRGLTLP